MAVSLPKSHYHTLVSFVVVGLSNVYHSTYVWPTALKLGCVTNFDMLFHMMGLTCLFDEIQFMLMSIRH